MQSIRLFSRLGLFALFLLLTAMIAVLVGSVEWSTRRVIDRTPYARFCFGGAARCLGFQVERQGRIVNGPVLFVCNHISWSDIPILGGVAPLRFLSKAEVRRWPVIGWLAKQAGTLFIERGKGNAGQSRQEITDALVSGQSVLVFPEGTTTAGVTVLPFHSRLLQAAVDAGVMIQPVSIGYRRHNQPDHLAPFIGDDEFSSHLLRMLKQPAVSVSLIFHEPVAVSTDEDLKPLSLSLQQTVSDGLIQIHWAGPASSSSSVASLT